TVRRRRGRQHLLTKGRSYGRKEEGEMIEVAGTLYEFPEACHAKPILEQVQLGAIRFPAQGPRTQLLQREVKGADRLLLGDRGVDQRRHLGGLERPQQVRGEAICAVG